MKYIDNNNNKKLFPPSQEILLKCSKKIIDGSVTFYNSTKDEAKS